MITPSRILIIRFSSLGDIILLTPIFREIRRFLPDAEIDFLTSTTFAGVCANNPHIHNIHAIDRKEGTTALKRFIADHPSKNYDWVIDAHRSLRSRILLIKWLGFFSGFSAKTVSIDKRSFKRNLLLTTGINLMKGAVSQRQAYLNLIRPITGSAKTDSRSELYPSPDNRQLAETIFQQNDLTGKSVVAIGPGASFSGKCWPKESFLELITGLQQAGHPVLLLGGGGEEEPRWLEENCPDKLLNLSGALSFLETSAVLAKCSLAVSNDSAVVHFAEAVQTPAISIFGPTVREFGYGPFLPDSRLMETDLSCRPCSRNGKGKCKNSIQRQCLRDITVSSILEASLQILQKSCKQ